MNKLQKISLLLTILGCLDFSLDVLLKMSFILRFLPNNSLWYQVYAFIIGVCAFIDLTIFSKES